MSENSHQCDVSDCVTISVGTSVLADVSDISIFFSKNVDVVQSKAILQLIGIMGSPLLFIAASISSAKIVSEDLSTSLHESSN